LPPLSVPAHAAPSTSKVWVCKYVRTPGGDEALKSGQSPIEVSGNSVDKDKDSQIFVGDQFADAQELSVVVQIGGADPGADICSATPLRPGGRRRAPSHRVRVAKAAASPSAWSGAVSCSSGPPSWRASRSGVAGLPPVGDVNACGRPAPGPPRAAGPDLPSGPARVRNAPK
jgi:hypothetical protein